MRVYLFIIVFVFCPGAFANAQSAFKGKELQKNHSYLLTYSELMSLKLRKRIKYLRQVGKYLSTLKEEPIKTSLLDFILPEAFASSQFRCIGGGVPVPGTQQNCGVSSYAGFSCPDGMEICNPLIFGLLPSEQPLCYANATTSKCYNNTITGQTTFFSDARFQSDEVKSAYEKFERDIDAICSGQASIQEKPAYKDEACRLVRRQTQVNRARNLALSTGSYQTRPQSDEGGELGGGDSEPVLAAAPATSSHAEGSPREVTNFNEEKRRAMVQEIRRNGLAEQPRTFISGLGYVMNDALKLPDGTYVNVTMAEARDLARAWGCRLPNREEAAAIRRYAQEQGQVFRAQSKTPNNTAQRYTNAQWMMSNPEMRRRSSIGRTTFVNGHFKWYIENGGGFSFYGFYAPPNCYGASSTGYCQNGGSGGHGYGYIDYSQSARFICNE